jgi:CubicO group peptidase (beta-lactamase class C family)
LEKVFIGFHTQKINFLVMNKNQQTLNTLVWQTSIKHQLPALGACVVNKNGKEVIKSVTGVRKLTTRQKPLLNNKALLSDQFNIGSVSKILVGYATALLIQKGVFKSGWQTTIKDVFPELANKQVQRMFCPGIHKDYLNATIEMLMSHGTGMHHGPVKEPPKEWMTALNINPKGAVKRRFKYVCAAIQDKPLFTPMGSDSSYSGGSIIVSAMMERLLGKHFEAIMDEHVFNPIGLEGAGYNVLHKIGKVDGIWQHTFDKSKNQITPVDSSIYELYRTNGAAGEAHFSVLNIIKFIKNILPGCAENKNILSGKNQLDYLYKVASISKANNTKVTRGGWIYYQSGNSKFTDVWHNGDNGRSYSHLEINPMSGYGYAVMTNVSSGNKGSDAVDELLVEIRNLIKNWD